MDWLFSLCFTYTLVVKSHKSNASSNVSVVSIMLLHVQPRTYEGIKETCLQSKHRKGNTRCTCQDLRNRDKWSENFWKIATFLTLLFGNTHLSILLLFFNPMRTTSRLVKRSSLPYIELIRRDVRKNSLMHKFVHVTFLKPFQNWLHTWTFRDMNQSEMVLEGQ